MTFSTILGVTEILCSFKLVLQGKTGKEIPESSRLEFLDKFSANNFALSNAEDNTPGPLNREPLSKTLLAIPDKIRFPSVEFAINSKYISHSNLQNIHYRIW